MPAKVNHMPVQKSSCKHFLEGDRIYLREVRVDDVGDVYYRWLSDPEVNRFLETRYIPQSLDNIRKYVQAMDGNRDQIFLAICSKDNDRHIGNIKLGPINWTHRFADVSLIVGEKDYWGKGIATAAISLVSAYAFETLNLHKLRAGCYALNEGSAKAFEKVGFRREGLISGLWQIGDKFIDEILLGMRAEDYFLRKN